ncbi:MAG: chitobiase/beta-hexosaminidase C-terminal domain-containing protein [Phaeodactylibacter sp.]|nr:chitobiase/beta-hexosaminidase C-terminal domain-containing protein [Phaeodactylibacter sp.]
MDLFINPGRLHPLLVHLPIGILIFAFLLEALKRWKKDDTLNSAVGLALLAGALFAVASVVTGLWLSGEGGYDEVMLGRHKWLGGAMAACSVLLYLSHQRVFGALSRFYAPLLLLSAGLLVLTGHYGGNITHGADYLFSHPEDAALVVNDIEAANAYETVIAPILKEKCNSCHNPSKAKGRLVMTTREGLMQGGKNGPVFDVGNPSESEFFRRVHLPESEKKHMPPKGKKQLDEEEMKLLEWWINNGACFDCIVGTMEGNEAVQPILDKYTTSGTDITAIRARPVDAAVLEKLNAEGIRAYPLAQGSPLLIVDLSGHQGLSRNTFRRLKKVRKNIVELNLSHSDFSDELAGQIGRFPNLNKLQLQKTMAGDATIRQLAELKYLGTLNIYGTRASDASIDALLSIPALQRLYTWQSAISELGINRLQEARPLLEIQHQVNEDIFGESKLNPPLITAGSELFVDSVVAYLATNFRNASIYYTLDGSEPDSCSTLYTDSVVIRESALLKAFTHKTGWEDSPPVEKAFFRAGIKAKRATLAQPPAEKYKGKGAASLIDLEKGTAVFTDGNWLGYEGMHMTATLELERKEEVSEVVVSALSAPASWIFFPRKLKVWLSEDGRDFRFAGETALPGEEPGAAPDMDYFRVAFDAQPVKYLKVEAASRLKNPDWHPNPGGKCWIFIDEVLVN